MNTTETGRTAVRHDQCEPCAFQESGHVLFAYLSGYSCLQTELVGEQGDYSAYSIIDYGRDTRLATLLLNDDHHPWGLNNGKPAEKLELAEACRRLSKIYAGGSVTLAVFRNGGDARVPLPLQMEYSDLKNLEKLRNLMGILSPSTDDQFMDEALQDALYTLTNGNVWDTVSDLASRLLQSGQLNRNDIEECLDEHGLL